MRLGRNSVSALDGNVSAATLSLMTSSNKTTVLCIASFFKGNEFIRECKQQGAKVVLLTKGKLANADWAFESLDDFIAIPGTITDESYLAAAIHLMRRYRVERVVALEEYDVVTAAFIRQHACIPGMRETAAHRFQDKLAMRAVASEVHIPQPDFIPLFNPEAVEHFMERIPSPWMLKPRLGASAMGIKKLHDSEAVWRALAELDARDGFDESPAFHLLEHYIPGDVFHVDSLVLEGQIVFTNVSHYCATPFEISQFGGVNVSHTLRHGSRQERDLLDLNRRLLEGFGFERGVTHAEFVRRAKSEGSTPGADATFCDVGNSSDDNAEADQFYFLEVAARVGGAHTADAIEAATGINVWREWAKIELATANHPYTLPPIRQDYGGITVSLARQKIPSTENYVDSEIVYRVNKPWHVGLILRSDNYDRLMDLLSNYRQRFALDFLAVAPPEEKPSQYL